MLVRSVGLSQPHELSTFSVDASAEVDSPVEGGPPLGTFSNLAIFGLSLGIMGVDESVLSEVVRRVLAVARPDRIILFGSAATGQMTKDSDIDILIVEPTAKNRHEESVAITDAIGDVRFPVDVKIISSERFEATKNIIGGIAYPAHKYGRILYEAA
jgi:predicted nucleotidyltransferase